MKRIIVIFFTTLISFNVGGVILWLRKYGISVDFNIVIKAHYAVSIYAIKCSFIAVIVDWISKDWVRRDKSPKYEIKSFYCEYKEMLCYIPKNTWSWYIYEINAIDNGKNSFDLKILNKELDNLTEGYYLSWDELKEIIVSFERINSCLILALNHNEDYQDVVKDDFVNFLCLIKIKDNECEVKINNSLIK